MWCIGSLINKGKSFIRRNTAVFRPAKPRYFTVPTIELRFNFRRRNCLGNLIADILKVAMINIDIDLSIDKTYFDQDSWLSGIIEKIKIATLMRATIN